MKLKVLLAFTAVAILCGCAVGGTVAWLAVRSEVTNTFVLGEISIDLTETTGSSYELLPGAIVAKDPKVTVHAGSEACWLFVKIEKSGNFDTYISYTPADGWIPLQDGVYYRVQEAVTADVIYPILQNDQVAIKDTLTQQQAKELKASGSYPEMVLKAYAVQRSGIASVEQAWAQIPNP